MQHRKIAIDFIGPRGNNKGTWADYVPIDCDGDGLIDYLYSNQLVNVNWDKVRPVVRKAKKCDKLGWQRAYSPLPFQIIAAVILFSVIGIYVKDPAMSLIYGAAGLSWIIYIGAKV